MSAQQSVPCNGSPSKRGGLRRPLRMLPLIEVAVLIVMVAAPIALNGRPELITLITNIAILSLLAISFDLCWGFSGIMTFGQALFFGVPGYVIALVGRDLGLSDIWLTLPLAMLTGLLLAFIVALFLLVGRRPTPIFIALGTLTGSYAAERLVSGWQYVGAGNGLSAVKLLQMGSYEFVEGTEFYSLACAILLAVYLGRSRAGALTTRPCARRHAPERGAARFPRLPRPDLQGAGVFLRRHDRRRRWRAL